MSLTSMNLANSSDTIIIASLKVRSIIDTHAKSAKSMKSGLDQPLTNPWLTLVELEVFAFWKSDNKDLNFFLNQKLSTPP